MMKRCILVAISLIFCAFLMTSQDQISRKPAKAPVKPTTKTAPAAKTPSKKPKKTSANDGQSLFEKGLVLWDASNYAEAFSYFKRSAELGNPQGMEYLGWAYLWGDGCAEDQAEAEEWLSKAAAKYREGAEKGNTLYMCRLAYLYEQGHGVSSSIDNALKWYRKAAQAGDPIGMFSLGFIYHNGIGVQTDQEEGIRWYRKSAERGNDEAQEHLANAYYYGSGVGQNYAEAARWYRKAAEQGNVNAQQSLADMYAKGIGVPRDKAEALKWYREVNKHPGFDASAKILELESSL